MPWFPELFSASVLERIRKADDARAAEPVPYFDGVRSGEIDALVGSFAGEPELHHPVRGRVKGRRAFERFGPEINAWLSERNAVFSPVERVLTPQRAIEETVMTLDGDTGRVEVPVAVTVGFAALGAYIGRNLSGGAGILFFIAAFACVFGLQFATARGREQLAIDVWFGLGLALRLAVAAVIAVCTKADPAALWHAAGATAATIAGLGAIGYATLRDLSSWARSLFWALLALVLGVVLIFVNIPHANVIYAVLGIVIFGGYTIFDFNRLRRAEMSSAVLIAASIFRHLQHLPLLPSAVRQREQLNGEVSPTCEK